MGRGVSENSRINEHRSIPRHCRRATFTGGGKCFTRERTNALRVDCKIGAAADAAGFITHANARVYEEEVDGFLLF